MKRYSIILFVLGFLCFTTLAAQEKESQPEEVIEDSIIDTQQTRQFYFGISSDMLYAILAFPRVAYTQNNGNHFSLGFKLPLSFKMEKNRWYAGALAHFGFMNDTFIATPEANLYFKLLNPSLKWDESSLIIQNVSIGAAISPYYAGPRVVLGNVFPVEIGYNFQFKSRPNTTTEGFFIKIGYDVF